MEQNPNLDALADRLREVRRQLSRSEPLSNVLDRQKLSTATLRAAQRLEEAVRHLQENDVPQRIAKRNAVAGLPWLIRVVEQRAQFLEQRLADPVDADITDQPSERR